MRGPAHLGGLQEQKERLVGWCLEIVMVVTQVREQQKLLIKIEMLLES